jgi:hypothetical protein|tara:strand:- start:30 stop:215 length:186 start_codon:yes stop_codon:yes gene_type:complete
MQNQIIVPAEIVTATGVSTGVGSAIVGWLGTNNDAISSVGIITGIIIGLIGLYFQYKRIKK